MIRLLIWLAGAAGFLYAISHYGYWHEAVALAVLMAAMFWFVGGGIWAMRGSSGTALKPRRDTTDAAAMRAAVARHLTIDEMTPEELAFNARQMLNRVEFLKREREDAQR
jgi:hypothetical protein